MQHPVGEDSPPGWYPHPERPEEEWYWNGTGWTESRWATQPQSRIVRWWPRPHRRFPRAKFSVAFDGQWQEEFDTLSEAVEWAQEVSATGRMTWVAERRPFFLVRLRAVFPESRAQEGKRPIGARRGGGRRGVAGSDSRLDRVLCHRAGLWE